MKTIDNCGKTLLRLLAICIVAIYGVAASSSVLQAADNWNRCDCDTPYVFSKTLSVCINGTAYSITVYGCDATPVPLEYVCDPLRQDRITTIKKICFNGTTYPLDYGCTQAFLAKLYAAIECTATQCTTPVGQWGNAMPLFPAVYCWTILFPRCVQCDPNSYCIEACADAPCCAYAQRWSVNQLGVCTRSASVTCTEEAPCVVGCTAVTCPTGDPACCTP